jgi:voltage-gated potassium channel
MSGKKITTLDFVIIILSIYILVELIVETLFNLTGEVSTLLNYIDNIICVFFLVEFFVRFFKSDNKLKFMKWGWIDLISSIPMVDFLRFGRLLRLAKLLRIIKAFKSTKNLVNYMFQHKAQGALTSMSIIAFLLVVFSSLAILQVETSPESNIKTAEDALWWSYVTITTVGYGDKFPVTLEGRLIAGFLMTAGVGLFGTFTALISSWFIKDSNPN